MTFYLFGGFTTESERLFIDPRSYQHRTEYQQQMKSATDVLILEKNHFMSNDMTASKNTDNGIYEYIMDQPILYEAYLRMIAIE